MAERSEAPTPRRLRQAREQGDLPHAPLLATVLVFLVAPALIAPSVVASLHDLEDTLRPSTLALQAELQPRAGQVGATLARALLQRTVPTVAILAVLAIAAAVLQGGVTFSWRKVAVNPQRLDALSGLARMFDATRWWAVARGAMVWFTVGAVLWATSLHLWPVASLSPNSVNVVWRRAATWSTHLAWLATGVSLPWAILDLLVARWSWLQRWKMTRAELRDEQQRSDGNVDVRRRQKALRDDEAGDGSAHALRTATILVVDVRGTACALRYASSDEQPELAPILVAKGRGLRAQHLSLEASRHGVPQVEDAELATALYGRPLERPIPESLYEATAQALRAAGITGPSRPSS